MIKKTCLILLLCLILLPGIHIKAAPPTVTLDPRTNILTFVTEDTKATSQTRWATLGFTVKNKPTNGFPDRSGIKSQDYLTWGMSSYTWDKGKEPFGQLMLADGEIKNYEENGKYFTKFEFSRDKVTSQFTNAGVTEETLKENKGNVFLNAILEVRYYDKAGKQTGKKGSFYTLKGIQKAEDWANPNDFADRFDIPIKYEPESVPVKLQIKENYKSTLYDVGASKVITDEIKINSSYNAKSDIPKSIASKKEPGQTYYLYRVYYVKLAKPTKKLANIQSAISPLAYPELYAPVLKNMTDRKLTVPDKGIEIVAVYKKAKVVNDEENSVIIEQELMDPIVSGTIKADTRGSERFEATEGIPTTESLYTNVFTNNHLLDYAFKRVFGLKYYGVQVEVTYNLSWTEEKDGEIEDKSDTVTINQPYVIEREYAYWEVERLNLYKVKESTIKNYALPSGIVKLTASGSAPTIQHQATKEHIIEPELKKIKVNGGTITGTGSRPNVIQKDFSDVAESEVDKIKVRNDKLVFNNIVYMDDKEEEEKTKNTKRLPPMGEIIDQNTLYKAKLLIDRNKTNGEYESDGNVTYSRMYTFGETEGPSLEYDIEDLNQVIIHTPTVADARITNNIADNQMINPNRGMASLVLDRSFTILLPTEGNHQDILGYGYRDYAKYIESRQVQFPFDVYQGNAYQQAGSWITLTSNEASFYLPIWVNEGVYSVDFRSISINAAANNGINKTEDLANLELENYVATDSVTVEISGRLYNFNLHDISDYPIWEKVFRYPDSLKHTGFNYAVGTKNRNGASTSRNPKYTLPLVNGSHPTYSTVGVLKAGYVTRFSVTTIGNMYNADDYIHIKPRFYYVDKNGSNRREVDLYYSETFGGKKNHLVLMGSDYDKTNVKAYRFGDNYISVPKEEIAITAAIKGKTEKEIRTVKRKLFTYTNIRLPNDFHSLIGLDYHNSLGLSKPTSVSNSKIGSSMQKWYGEYYIPSEVHAVSKGFNVLQYAKENGINYRESFWFNDGYIIINFDIVTVQNKESNLSYTNPVNSLSGYCNMWNKEGFQYFKEDNKNNGFNFLDGDYVLYYADTKNLSAAKDYRQEGTH